MTSKDVSRKIIKAFGYKKLSIGHVGTLDPFAEGVLPVLIGKATRLQDYLLEMPKSYEFDMQFGYETSTLDCEGEVIKSRDTIVHKQDLESAIIEVAKQQFQIPPIYSAIKVAGKPLYQYARQDQSDQIDLETLRRPIVIYDLKLLNFDELNKKATLSVQCSKGTYVRCLARDLAYKLNHLATVTRLVRTASANLDKNQCFPLELLLANPVEILKERLIQIGNLPILLDKITFTSPELIEKLKHGQLVHTNVPTTIRASMNTPQTILLENTDGKIFGLGKAQLSDRELLTIHMFRGLE